MKIWASSDFHGMLPEPPPEGYDLYVIAGDICPLGGNAFQERWLHDVFIPWLEKGGLSLSDPRLILIWGNHDYVGTALSYGQVETRDDLKLWASPWSKEILPDRRSRWVFMEFEENLDKLYTQIPQDTKIIVSHGPPYGACDKVLGRFLFNENEDPHVGSKSLRKAVEEIQPDLLICGHIHEGYGEDVIGKTRVVNVAHVDANYKPIHPTLIMEI